MIKLLRHDKNIPREDDGAVRFFDFLEEFKVKYVGTLRWTFGAWVSFLQKGQDGREEFNIARILVRQINPCTSSEFRDIPDKILLIHYCRAAYCHRMTFPAHRPHRELYEVHSIVKSGLIPGEKSLRRDRQSVFVTAVNPMCSRKDLEKVEYDFDKQRIAPCNNTWESSSQ